MNGIIYIIKNYINDKCYIGQTIQDVEKRFKQHMSLNKQNQNQLIYKAIKKYGKENFYYEVLEDNINSYYVLNEKEEYYIDKYKTIAPNGYNLCPGGANWRKCPLINDIQNIECVINLYNKGLSSQKISEQFNVSKSTILKILHNNSCTIRKKSYNLPDKTSHILFDELYEYFIIKKMSCKDIAKIYNVDSGTIRRRIRQLRLREYNTED